MFCVLYIVVRWCLFQSWITIGSFELLINRRENASGSEW